MTRASSWPPTRLYPTGTLANCSFWTHNVTGSGAHNNNINFRSFGRWPTKSGFGYFCLPSSSSSPGSAQPESLSLLYIQLANGCVNGVPWQRIETDRPVIGCYAAGNKDLSLVLCCVAVNPTCIPLSTRAGAEAMELLMTIDT